MCIRDSLYTVNRGDNVYAIARRFNTRVDYIKNMNSLDDKMMIYPGQQLLVPVLFEKMPPMKPQPVSYTHLDVYKRQS